MRCGIGLSADEILGEPDDQVIIHGHVHAFAERPLAAAVGDIAEDARPRPSAVSRAPAPERPGQRDLVNQRNAAAPETGIVGLPHDRGATDGIGAARGDKARALRAGVIGEILPGLSLTVTDPLDEEPDGRLGTAIADRLDGNAGNTHAITLAWAGGVLSCR